MHSTLRLPVDDRAPGLARSLVVGDLSQVLSGDCFDTLCLLITEVVTNSLRHANFGANDHIVVQVKVSRDQVRASVCDPGGPGRPELSKPGVWSDGGRGLVLVDELADRWGVSTGDGTCVWFELDA